MEAVRMPVAIFVANPPNRGVMLGLSPEEHGYGKNVDGKDALRNNVKFDRAGRYEAYDEAMAKILRAHTGNTANGGETFFEIPSMALTHARAIEGITATLPDGGLSEEDVELVNQLTKLSAGKIPPPAVNGVIEKMKRAVERFKVYNFEVPDPDRKITIIRGRLAELLELLEGEGITAE